MIFREPGTKLEDGRFYTQSDLCRDLFESSNENPIGNPQSRPPIERLVAGLPFKLPKDLPVSFIMKKAADFRETAMMALERQKVEKQTPRQTSSTTTTGEPAAETFEGAVRRVMREKNLSWTKAAYLVNKQNPNLYSHTERARK